MHLSLAVPQAVAQIRGGTPNGEPTGTVSFYPCGTGTLVVADIHGLPRCDSSGSGGIFGFHIHEGNSCQGSGFPETKGHFNPEGNSHPHHAGDLPPLFGCEGDAFLAVRTDRFTIPEVLGRTVVIHSQRDDFTSQPAGDSGSKIACGVIRPV